MLWLDYICWILVSCDAELYRSLDVSMFGENKRKDLDVTFYELGCILQAMENFPNSNKLGQGGFGQVYKVYAFNFSTK